MKLAIIGSRDLAVNNMKEYITDEVSEIVSGGARGIDTQAAELARESGIPLTVFLPDYKRYGRGAPLRRNKQIAEYADAVLAFWDGNSKGTLYTINLFKEMKKKVTVVKM